MDCIVTYGEEGRTIQNKGILRLSKPSEGNIFDTVELVSKDSTIIINIDKIIRIERADKDEYFRCW